MLKLKRVRPGAPILADDYNAMVDAILDLVNNPRVSAPLASKDGVIYLGEDYDLWDAITTSEISPRSGEQMGSGTAKLRIDSVAGLLRDAPGYSEVTVWNILGGDPIGTGIRIYVRVVKGKWRIVAADCSS